MRFSPSEENLNYPILHMVSSSGQWECGIRPLLYDYRVSAGKIGTYWHVVDYSCGDKHGWSLSVLFQVMLIFSSISEDAESWEVKKIFPTQTVKPIWQDVETWEKLLELGNRYVEFRN